MISSLTSFSQTNGNKVVVYSNKLSPVAMDTISLDGNTIDYNESLSKLRSKYIAQGYLNLITISRDSSNQEAYSKIYLGNLFSKITIKELSESLPESMIHSSLSRKRIHQIQPSQLSNFLDSRKDRLNESGFPFAEVVIERWDFSDPQNALLYIRTTINEKRTLDRIVVEGYPTYPKNIVNRLAARKATYNQRNINKIQTAINTLPYLTTLREPEVLFKKDSTLLYVYVEKRNANSADGLITFNSSEDGTLVLNGYLEATLENNFNYGERFDFIYRNDDQSQTFLDLDVSVPAIILDRIGVNGKFNINRRDSIYQNSTISTGFNYQFQSSWRTSLNYYSKNSNQDADNFQIEGYKSNGVVSNTKFSTYSSSKLQPERLSLEVTAGAYERKLTTGKADQQYSIAINAEKLWNVSKKINFLTSLKSGLLKTDNLQFNELVQIGGNKSIRGFNQNSIDTAAHLNLQTEFRYSLNGQIYLNVVNDAAVFEDFNTRNPQYLYGLGAGFGILTNAGILRLQVVNGNFLTSNTNNSNTIAHLNFIALF